MRLFGSPVDTARGRVGYPMTMSQGRAHVPLYEPISLWYEPMSLCMRPCPHDANLDTDPLLTKPLLKQNLFYDFWF